MKASKQSWLSKLRATSHESWAFWGLMATTAALYLTNLTNNGMANSYYSASVQAASTSWKALLYGSLDGASFITVDKPPVAIWFMGLSARIFGFSSWSMLLPSALAGIATVAIVYFMVKRLFGARSALIAGATLAMTPVAALMFRFNNPDSFLTLLLAASGYTFIRALDTKRALLWLSLTGVLTGFAFNTKMLQGLILLPVMALIYLVCAQPKLLVRIRNLTVAGVALMVSTFWWPVVVWLTPATSRPYVGSTSDNSIWNLIFGYNGFGRLFGSGMGQGGPGGGMGRSLPTGSQAMQNIGQGMPAIPGGFGGDGGGRMMGGGGPGGTGFGGQTGLLRVFNTDFGPNIAWFAVLSLICAGLAIWLLRRMPRHDKQRAAVLFFTGWVVLHALVFSVTSGTIHPYYVVVMAPAVAALVGIGAPYIWKAYARRTTVAWILPLSIAATSIVSCILLSYGNDWPWLGWTVLAAGGISSLAFLLPTHYLTRQLQYAIAGLAVAAVVAGPAAFTLSTVAAAHSGSIPTSGPSATAIGQTNNESASADATLVAFLLENQGSATWLAAVSSANESAPLQISSGQPVMAMGGFSGSDAAMTVDTLKDLVTSGRLKYYVTNSGNGLGGGRGGFGGNSSVTSWIEANAAQVEYGGSATVYDLTTAL